MYSTSVHECGACESVWRLEWERKQGEKSQLEVWKTVTLSSESCHIRTMSGRKHNNTQTHNTQRRMDGRRGGGGRESKDSRDVCEATKAFNVL